MIKQLPNLDDSVKETLYQAYLVSLNQISKEILLHYNEENQSEYTLEEVREFYEEAYLNNGILSVLLSSYLPHMLDDDLKDKESDNPRNEFEASYHLRLVS